MNMFNNNKALWTSYNNTVVELEHLNKKLSRAMSSYEMWLEIALACEDNDEYNNLVDNKVCPKWAKVLKLKEKVEAAKLELEKIKARFVWSERLSGYKSVSKVEENSSDEDDSYRFEMVKYN